MGERGATYRDELGGGDREHRDRGERACVSVEEWRSRRRLRGVDEQSNFTDVKGGKSTSHDPRIARPRRGVDRLD